MFNLGFQEILVVLVFALIFLGPKMLPDIASGLGKAIREVRKAAADVRGQIELDDAIRKPLEELREATLLPPEELKRRDQEKAAVQRAQREERERRAAELREQVERDKQAQAAPAPEPAVAAKPPGGMPGATLVMNPPPDDNLPPFTPHPQVARPAAAAPAGPGGAAIPASEPDAMAAAPTVATVAVPTPAEPAVEVPAPASPSGSQPGAGLPPPPVMRRSGLKLPPPLPPPVKKG